MPNLLVKQAFPIFTDRKGEPLEGGFIYIGTAGVDPEVQANRIVAYFDKDATPGTEAAQPIRTVGGFPVNDSNKAVIYVAEDDYSIKVCDKNNVVVYESLNVSDPTYSESSSSGSDITALESRVDDIESDIDTQGISISDLQTTVSGQGTDIANLETTQSSQATQISSVETSVSDIEQDIQTGEGGKIAIFYCSQNGSGDFSGIDASNRLPSNQMFTKLDTIPHVKFFCAAGDYTAVDPFAPFGSGQIVGKIIEIILEGNCTFYRPDMVASDIMLYKVDNASTYTATFPNIFVNHGSNFIVEGDSQLNDTQKVNVTATNTIAVNRNSLFRAGSTMAVTCVQITVRHNSTFYSNNSDLNVTSVNASAFEVEYGSIVDLGTGDFDKPNAGGSIDYNSYMSAGGYTDQTPTASNSSYII